MFCLNLLPLLRARTQAQARAFSARIRYVPVLFAATVCFFAGPNRDTAEAAAVASTATGNWSGAATSAWPLTNRTGTVTSLAASAAITGVGTLFTTELTVGN